MARTAYKALYLHQLQTAGEEKGRADRAERKLARIQKALVPMGQRTLERYGPATEESKDIAIGLPPEEYVAAEAFFEAHARFSSYEEGFLPFVEMVWRGRQVRQL